MRSHESGWSGLSLVCLSSSIDACNLTMIVGTAEVDGYRTASGDRNNSITT
jgi:hypothetical protein